MLICIVTMVICWISDVKGESHNGKNISFILFHVSVHLEQYQAKNGYLLRGLGPMNPSGPLPPLGWAKSPSLCDFFF